MPTTRTRPVLTLVLALLSGLAAACSDVLGSGDQVMCTASVEPALVVEITDAATGRLLADSAQGTAQDGGYVDTLRPFAMRSALPADLVSRAAADERAGLYAVTVTRAGYQPWSVNGVRVTRGVCHVNTVRLAARLSPISP